MAVETEVPTTLFPRQTPIITRGIPVPAPFVVAPRPATRYEVIIGITNPDLAALTYAAEEYSEERAHSRLQRFAAPFIGAFRQQQLKNRMRSTMLRAQDMYAPT